MIELRSFYLALISIIVPLTLTSCVKPLQGKEVQRDSQSTVESHNIAKQDLQEGSQLIIEIQTTPSVPKIDERELKNVMRVIEGRIKGLGISQAVVQQTKAKNQISVQLPGIKDPTQAIRVLGATAQLEFKKQKPKTETQLSALLQSHRVLKEDQKKLQTSKDKAAIAKNQAKLKQNNQAISELFVSNQPPLTGRYLKDAFSKESEPLPYWFGSPNSQPSTSDAPKISEINITFDKQGGDSFATITKELAGTGRAIGIFIDNELISSPIVGQEFAKTGILGGQAVITGNFTINEAQELAAQIRGGALPVPIKITAVTNLGK